MKGEKLLLEMIIIVLLVSVVCFWTLNEWRKRYPEPVKIEDAELVFKRDWEKANRIRHIKTLLCGSEKGTMSIGRQGKWDLKDELHRLLGDSRPVKVYAGIWHRDYLEVIGK